MIRRKRTNTVYGGNSGYVGYSKSKRAVEAEERGLRSVSQMDRDFADEVSRIVSEELEKETRLTLKEVREAAKRSFYDEWHHTSVYGNKTKYYSAETIADTILDTRAYEQEREIRAAKVKEKKEYYDNLKDRNPGWIILLHCGYSYETFCDDADKVARVLGIQITKEGDIQTATFPCLALETNLIKLLSSGLRVAIYDYDINNSN